MGTQSGRSGHATWYLTVSLVSQNQAGNYSTLRVTFSAQCDSGWGGSSFASGIGATVDGYGSFGYNINGPGVVIADFYMNVGHDANGFCNYSIGAHSNDTGTSAYGGPMDLRDSGSLPRIPKPPNLAPVLTASVTGPKQITVNAGIPSGYDERGSSTISIDLAYSKDGGAWTGSIAGGWGARVFNNLAPGSYIFRGLARNGAGNGPTSPNTPAQRIVAGGKRWDNTDPLNFQFKDFQIMRRWTGAAWVDIASAKRCTDVAANTWIALTGV